MKKLFAIFLILLLPVSTFAAMSYEDFTDSAYESTFPVGTDITLGTSSITLSDAGAEGRITKYQNYEYFTGFRDYFKINITSSTVGNTGLFAHTDRNIPVHNWTEGSYLYWTHDGANHKIGVKDVESTNSDESVNLSLSTDYWVKPYHHHTRTIVEIYSAADMGAGDLVDTLTITGIDAQFRASHVFPVFGITTADPTVSGVTHYPHTSATGWSTSGTGLSVTTDRGYSVFKNTGAGSNYTRSVTLPNICEYRTRHYYEGLLANTGAAPYGLAYIRFGINNHYVWMQIYADEINIRTNAGGWVSTSIPTYNGIHYEYAIQADSTTTDFDVNVYRRVEGEQDWTLLFSDDDIYNATGNTTFYAAYAYFSGTGALYEDYSSYQTLTDINSPPADWNTDETIHIEGTISNVIYSGMDVNNYSFIGKAITGDLENEFTDLTAGTTLNTGGDNVVEATGGELHIENGGAYRQTWTAATNGGTNGTTILAKVSAIAEGNRAYLVSLQSGSTPGTNVLTVFAEKIGGKYYFGSSFNSEEQRSNYEVKLDTYYIIRLFLWDHYGYSGATASQGGKSVTVNGQTVGFYAGGLTASYPNRIIFGDEDDNRFNESEFYVSWFHMFDETFIYHMSDFVRASNDDIVLACRQSGGHNQHTAGKAHMLTSSDDGTTWSYEQLIDTASRDDYPNFMMAVNDDILLTLYRDHWIDELHYTSDDYGQTWSTTTPDANWNVFDTAGGIDHTSAGSQVFFTESGDNYMYYRDYVYDATLTNCTVGIFAYNIDDGTTTTVRNLATGSTTGDFHHMYPNEGTMWRIPAGMTNAGRLYWLTVWADHSVDADYEIRTSIIYTDDSDTAILAGTATWSAHAALDASPYYWGYLCGHPTAQIINEHLIIHSRIMETTGGIDANNLMHINLDDMTVQSSMQWNHSPHSSATVFRESANGSLLPPSGTTDNILVFTNAFGTTFNDIALYLTLVQCEITTPSSDPHSTSTDTLTLSGTASTDSGSISAVTWSNNLGGSGTASGTTSWTITDAQLYEGDNVFTVTATDGIGSFVDTITVTYAPATGGILFFF
jgi:hypothetical protein